MFPSTPANSGQDDLGHGLPDPPRQVGLERRGMDPRIRHVSAQIQALEIRNRPQRHRIHRHIDMRPGHCLVRPPHGARIETAQSHLQTYIVQRHRRHHPHPSARLPALRAIPMVPSYALCFDFGLCGRHAGVHDLRRDVRRLGDLSLELLRGTVPGAVEFAAEDQESGRRSC